MFIEPRKNLEGEVRVPGDKSISHRSAILGAICGKNIKIEGFLRSKDCLSTISVLRGLGVDIKLFEDVVMIAGRKIEDLLEPKDILYVGNSGTTIRLLSGLLTAVHGISVLTGDNSINQRPMKRIISPLREMGAVIYGRSSNTRPPIVVLGGKKIKGSNIVSEVSSAQVKTAILLAGLNAEGYTTIKQPGISRDHTERMLEYFGVDIEYDGRITRLGKDKRLKPKDIKIPGDISSAVYIIVAALITRDSNILIKDVGINPTRTYILDVLKKMGGKIEIKNKRFLGLEPIADIEVASSKLRSIIVKGKMIPNIIDDIPALCIAASFSKGKTVIKDAGELRVKESDRIEAIYSQLKKLGVETIQREDGIEITGKEDFRPNKTILESFGDHRMALSLSIMAIASENGLEIDGFECSDISFPGYYETIRGL